MPIESAPAAPVAAAPAPVAAAVETPAPAVQATLPLTPVVQAPAPPAVDPNVVPIPKAMYEEFLGYKATVAKLEADRQAAEVARAEIELKAQIEKGQIQEVLTNLKKQSDDLQNSERARRAEIEKRTERFALETQLATALAGQNLVAGAAEQLATLWGNKFVVEAAGDTYAVRTPLHQTVKDYVATQLATPEYAHFVRPSSAGGVGTQHGAAQAGSTPAANPIPEPVPANFGEFAILRMQKQGLTQQVDARIASARNADGTVARMPGFMRGVRQA
jgi:hypothetical protein